MDVEIDASSKSVSEFQSRLCEVIDTILGTSGQSLEDSLKEATSCGEDRSIDSNLHNIIQSELKQLRVALNEAVMQVCWPLRRQISTQSAPNLSIATDVSIGSSGTDTQFSHMFEFRPYNTPIQPCRPMLLSTSSAGSPVSNADELQMFNYRPYGSPIRGKKHLKVPDDMSTLSPPDLPPPPPPEDPPPDDLPHHLPETSQSKEAIKFIDTELSMSNTIYAFRPYGSPVMPSYAAVSTPASNGQTPASTANVAPMHLYRPYDSPLVPPMREGFASFGDMSSVAAGPPPQPPPPQEPPPAPQLAPPRLPQPAPPLGSPPPPDPPLQSSPVGIPLPQSHLPGEIIAADASSAASELPALSCLPESASPVQKLPVSSGQEDAVAHASSCQVAETLATKNGTSRISRLRHWFRCARDSR